MCVCVNLELGCAGVKVALLNGNKIMPKTRSNNIYMWFVCVCVCVCVCK